MEEPNLGEADLLINPNEKRSISDNEVRKKAARTLADDFLLVNEVTLESRTYLVKSTLPSVVVALEQLMKEIKSKEIPLTFTKQVLKQPDMVQRDNPNSTFDSINWLAQNLLRNNAKHTLSRVSPYAARVNEVAHVLEERIIEIAAEKERKRVAAELSMMMERERLDKERLERLAKQQTQYSDLLSVSFKLWVNALWRKEPGNIFKFELLSQLKSISEFPDLATNQQLITKIQNLMTVISTPNSTLPLATNENTIFNTNEPLYSLDCATIIRWDQEFYVKMFLRLMIDWSLDDLNTYLRLLSSMLVEKSSRINDEFTKAVFIPKFPKIFVVRDWFQQLASIVQVMDLSDSPFKDLIKKAFQGFCIGKEDPKFTFVSSVNAPDLLIENENSAVGFAETAYVRFAKCILGEFGMDSFVQAMRHIERESLNQVVISDDKPSIKMDPIEKPERTDSRGVIEAAAMKSLALLIDNQTLDVAGVCDSVLAILSNAFESLHEKKNVYGRIALKETSILKLVDGKDSIKQDEGIANSVVTDTFLRIVACSALINSELRGKHIPKGENVDYQMFAKESSASFSKCTDDPIISQDIFFTSKQLEREKYATSYIGCILSTGVQEHFGTIGLIIQGKSFENDDLAFLDRAKTIATSIIEKVEKREKSIELVLNAKTFIQSRLGVDIEAYLNDFGGVYQIQEMFADAEHTKRCQLVPEKDLPKLEAIQKSIALSSVLTKFEKATFKPFFVQESCLGVLQITKLEDDQNNDLERFVATLSYGLTLIQSEAFGSNPDDYTLDGERGDVNARRKMMFAKLLLVNARKGLAKIDSKALAELKSYKKPPKSIHLIMKGPLYIIGHSPKDLKTWNDTIKHVKEEFVKDVLSFDPTLPLKSVRFKRARRVMNALSWRDTNQKSSEPAQLISDWLFIVLILREIAVANRKSRPDLFERVSTADSAASDTAPDDGLEIEETLDSEEPDDTTQDATESSTAS